MDLVEWCDLSACRVHFYAKCVASPCDNYMQATAQRPESFSKFVWLAAFEYCATTDSIVCSRRSIATLVADIKPCMHVTGRAEHSGVYVCHVLPLIPVIQS
jgi:hypothetical protein